MPTGCRPSAFSPAASPAAWTARSAFRRDCGLPRAVVIIHNSEHAYIVLGDVQPRAAGHCGLATAGPLPFVATPLRALALPKTQPRLSGAFLGGRYWARTSDPQLVELVLSQLS